MVIEKLTWQTIRILSSTFCGKSTLINFICKFWIIEHFYLQEILQFLFAVTTLVHVLFRIIVLAL